MGAFLDKLPKISFFKDSRIKSSCCNRRDSFSVSMNVCAHCGSIRYIKNIDINKLPESKQCIDKLLVD